MAKAKKAKKAKSTPSASDTALEALRAYGMRYPGVTLKSPWPGHADLAVDDKTFAYLPPKGEPFSVGCKLPSSSSIALVLPYCTPMGYGLGKSGWVSATPPEDEIDLEMFEQWIDESYRAQAPKKYLKAIGPTGPGPFPDHPFGDPPSTRKPVARKPARAKAKRPAARARKSRG